MTLVEFQMQLQCLSVPVSREGQSLCCRLMIETLLCAELFARSHMVSVSSAMILLCTVLQVFKFTPRFSWGPWRTMSDEHTDTSLYSGPLCSHAFVLESS